MQYNNVYNVLTDMGTLQHCLKTLPVAAGTLSSLSLDSVLLVDLYSAPEGLQ